MPKLTKPLLAAFALATAALLAAPRALRADTDWGDFPADANPTTVGKRIVNNLIPRATQTTWARSVSMIYPEVCVAYGCLRFCDGIKDQQLLDQIVAKYDLILTDRGKTMITRPNHVDQTVFAALPLEIYILTASPAEKQVALAAAKARPPVTPIPAPPQGGGGRPGAAGTQPRGGRAGGLNAGRGPATQGARGATSRPNPFVAMTTEPAGQIEAEAQWAEMKLPHQDQMTRFLIMGKEHADTQWASPDPATGLTDQTRWWVDDMFMITAAECQAYRATGDQIYLDRAAKEMAAYLDKLQQDNGLFFHADDSHFYWGRGNGWFAAGMAELLSDLPANHPQRARILDGYKKMMAGLLKYQAPDGMWRQLIDTPDSWEETSGTGMFTFAMARGVSNGWLDAPYKDAAKKAWIALASHVNDKGEVNACCEGTNKGYTTEYYLTRGQNTGDFHGQAATIWAAWAMLK